MTINQVMLHGWKEVAKGETYFIANKSTSENRKLEIGYEVDKKKMQVLKVWERPNEGTVRETIYYGSCKDELEFQQIMSLLDIT